MPQTSNFYPLLALSGLIMGLSVSFSAKAATLTAPIPFAYRSDGNPVSYATIQNQQIVNRPDPRSFCGKLAQYLANERNYALEFKEEAFDYRFQTFIEANQLKGKPLLECGPNSLTQQRWQDLQAYGMLPSQAFLVTDLRLLIRKGQLSTLQQHPEKLRVAVLASPVKTDSKTGGKPNTKGMAVTSAAISNSYPSVTIVTLASRVAVVTALQELQQPVIDAYASDYAILDTIWRKELGAAAEHYVIEPAVNGLSREEYRVFVYNHTELLHDVNAWLQSAAGQAAMQELQPQRDSLQMLLAALNQQANLQQAYGWLFAATLVLLGLVLAPWLWLLKRRRNPASNHAALQAVQALGRDLHDTGLQSLMGVKLYLQAALNSLGRNDHAQARTHVDKSVNALDTSIQEIRAIAHALQQPLTATAPDKIDLLLAEFRSTTGLDVRVTKGVHCAALPPQHAEHLYAIISEALTNIHKYAHAKRVLVRLEQVGKRLHLEIHDDGNGFDTSHLASVTGIGIRNMQQRVQALRGTFAIDGSIGTRIQITLPCKEGKA